MRYNLIVLGVIDLIDDADESAMKIFENARQLLVNNDLDIGYLTALGADNTNVNISENHSVYSLFKNELPDILKGIILAYEKAVYLCKSVNIVMLIVRSYLYKRQINF